MAEPKRNEPCRCGSGKKYKNCCLIKDQQAEELRDDTLAEEGFLALQGLSADYGGLKPAEAAVRYAQPLVDEARNEEELQHAFSLAQICWNLALLTPEECEAALQTVKQQMNWSEREYRAQREMIDFMVQRHQQMFPRLHQKKFGAPSAPTPPRDSQQEAQDLMYEGWEALSRDPREAEQLFKKALQRDPGLADAHNGMGSIARACGDLRQAEAHYRTALEKARARLSTEDPQAFEWWGEHETRPYMRARHSLGLLYEELGRYEEAIAEYRAILERNPNDNQGVRYLLAPLYQFKGDLEGALRAYQEFARDYPDDMGDPHHSFNWGLALYAAGKQRDAVAKLRAACFENLYLAPVLLGQRVKRHRIWHAINTAEPDYAEDYPALYGKLWEETPGALNFLRRLWTAPEVQADLKRYLELSKWLEKLDRAAKGFEAKWQPLYAEQRAIVECEPSPELLRLVSGE